MIYWHVHVHVQCHVMQGFNGEASVGQPSSTVGAAAVCVRRREGDFQPLHVCTCRQGPAHGAESALAALPRQQDHNVSKGAG